MPELPEVETTKTSLNPLIGQTVTKVYTSGKRLRECLPNDLSSLVGYQFTKAVRRAKYLLLYFTTKPTTPKRLCWYIWACQAVYSSAALMLIKH